MKPQVRDWLADNQKRLDEQYPRLVTLKDDRDAFKRYINDYPQEKQVAFVRVPLEGYSRYYFKTEQGEQYLVSYLLANGARKPT